MQIAKAIHELIEVVTSIFLLKSACLCDIVEERAAINELEKNVLEWLH